MTEPYQMLNILSCSFRRCNILAFWLIRFDFIDLLISVAHLAKAKALILRNWCRNSFSASFQTMKSGSSSKDSELESDDTRTSPLIPFDPCTSTVKLPAMHFRNTFKFLAGVEEGVLSLLQGSSIASNSFSVNMFLFKVLLVILQNINNICVVNSMADVRHCEIIGPAAPLRVVLQDKNWCSFFDIFWEDSIPSVHNCVDAVCEAETCRTSRLGRWLPAPTHSRYFWSFGSRSQGLKDPE